MITFIKATVNDVYKVISVQTQCFIEFLDRYHDDTINPTNESAASIRRYIEDLNSTIYFIKNNDTEIGIIKLKKEQETIYKIDDFGILPEFRDQHLGTNVMIELQKQYAFVHTWRLSTILEEERNIHFYEKLGFKRVLEAAPIKINDQMTIVDYQLNK
ncbi:MAG: GNAT family N-acetyltransferase [Beduini sp.]|uniref:GNAT family N-acetyltransferase n=1 Tax=Beduini sp. TaxID=1922300 RepID=UPI003990CE44